MIEKVVKSDSEWNALLTPDEYRLLRKKGTEPAFDNAFFDNKRKGIYTCAGCELELFSSDAKFDSGTGWPSFWQPIAEDLVENHVDRELWHDQGGGSLRPLRRSSRPRF